MVTSLDGVAPAKWQPDKPFEPPPKFVMKSSKSCPTMTAVILGCPVTVIKANLVNFRQP